MRHNASLLASLEGISRAAFMLAKELSVNSRSGLTPRFLSKKLDLPIEEVEYLVDVNHRLLYTDLTKIRLAPEGMLAIKRILEGLESHGDVAALKRRLRALPDQEIQRIEERLGLDAPSKKALFEQMLRQVYGHPEAVAHYVASKAFSQPAREVFDVLWQSRDGIMTVAQLYAAYGGSEFEAEQALWELLQGCACFEIFRFDSEDRLARRVALLKELREYRKTYDKQQADHQAAPKPVKNAVEVVRAEGLAVSECLCRLTAAIAAHPVRLRNDGDVFREDKRRLETIRGDSDDPSLSVCLWIAAGLEWVAQVDNTLRAGNLDDIAEMHPVRRHRLVYEWLAAQNDEGGARQIMERALGELKPQRWYPVMDFLEYVQTLADQSEAPRLRAAGAHYEYVSPSANRRLDARIARALEESLCWLGLVDRGEIEGDSCFRVTELGAALLAGETPPALLEQHPPRQSMFVVQPNFEIVAAIEDMDPLMTAQLEAFAERGSTDKMLVYRLTRESFVRALQEGRQAESFITFLLNHSRGGLPENVRVTLGDWCGTAKQVRLRTYHVIEADDPLVVAEIEHHRQWREHIVPIPPHKALRYQNIAKAQLKRALEKEGYIVR